MTVLMARTRTRYDGGCDLLLVHTFGRRRGSRRPTNPPTRILHDGRKIRTRDRKSVR